MRCPRDETTLAVADRHGIEIDYCPSCRGVWLDRGELDKILERELALSGPPPRDERDDRRERDRGRDRDDRYDDRYDDRAGPWNGGRGKPRKRFLSELFDFD